MRIEQSANSTPFSWNPQSDQTYSQFRKYSDQFFNDSSKENAVKLYEFMHGNSYSQIRTPFEALLQYIHPQQRQEAFTFFQNGLWELHHYIYNNEADPASARMWLQNLWRLPVLNA